MVHSSTTQKAAQSSGCTNFEQWKEDLLLRESLVAESKTKRNSPAVALPPGACGYLRKGFDLSPQEFERFENVVLGRPCGDCPCNYSDALAGRSLLHVNVGQQGHRSCTPTDIAPFVYETAVMILQMLSKT